MLRRSSAASQSSVASDKAAEGGTAATGSAASPAADSRKRASSIGAAADSLLADLAEGNERLPARREQPAARTEPIVPQPLTTAAHSTTPAANSAEAATGPASRSSGTDSGWGTPRASVNSANDAHGSNPTELPDDASGDVFPSFAAGSASAPSATANGGKWRAGQAGAMLPQATSATMLSHATTQGTRSLLVIRLLFSTGSALSYHLTHLTALSLGFLPSHSISLSATLLPCFFPCTHFVFFSLFLFLHPGFHSLILRCGITRTDRRAQGRGRWPTAV